MRKAPGDIIILHMCTKIYDQMNGRTDGWMDRRTEKLTYRGGCLTYKVNELD